MEFSKERMVELAQNQLDAYNKKDIDKFCACYHPDIEAHNLNTQELMFKGMLAFRERYQVRFSENPDMHCELRSRVVLADSVLDEEWVTGIVGADKPSHVVAIYYFKDNLIGKVFFTR